MRHSLESTSNGVTVTCAVLEFYGGPIQPCILCFCPSGSCSAAIQLGRKHTIKLSSESNAPSQADHMQPQPSTGAAFLAGKPASAPE